MTNAPVSFETGMPVLPEDSLFWRVSEARGGMWGGPPVARVHIIEITRNYIKVPKVLFKLFGKEFTLGEKNSFEEKENYVVTVAVETTEDVDVDHYNDNDEMIGIKTIKRTSYVSGDDLTPEVIYAAAERALERYKEITKSRGYLGDYPPKKLERSGFNGVV